MGERTRAAALAVSIVFAAVVVSLGCFEGVLSALDLYPAPPNPIRPARPELYQPDGRIGYRLWRSAASCERYPPDNPQVVPVVSNSAGFRDGREFGSPDSRRRILVVGDSFVYGSGVRRENRFTDLLEALEPSWRVDNLGMAGWGLDLMVRAVEQFGAKARPDVVVLAVYTDDFRRVLPDYAGMGYAIPKFELKDGNLVTVPYPGAAGWRRLRIVQFAKSVYWRFIRDRNRYDLNGALLERFLALARDQKSRPVLVFLPGRGDTAEDRTRRGFLRDWAARRKVSFADLTDAIHRAGTKNIYLKGNPHWNETGHRLAAQALHEFLRAEIGGTR